MAKLLTPKTLAPLAKAKPIHLLARGSNVGLYPLGARVLHVAHLLEDERPGETESGFTVSTLSMKSELVVDGELTVRDARVVEVRVRGTAIWLWYVQKDEGFICRITAAASGKLTLEQTYPMPKGGQLLEAGDQLIAIKQGDGLDLYTAGKSLEKVGSHTPVWKRGTGLVAATLHKTELAILGTPHAGLQRLDVSNVAKPVVHSTVAGKISGPGHLAAFDDYLLAFGHGICEIYRSGPKGELLGKLKISGDTLLRVGDVCFFCTVSTLMMKHGKESQKIDIVQLGDEPAVLPAVKLPVMWIRGLAPTGSHLHVIGDIDEQPRIATFAL